MQCPCEPWPERIDVVSVCSPSCDVQVDRHFRFLQCDIGISALVTEAGFVELHILTGTSIRYSNRQVFQCSNVCTC